MKAQNEKGLSKFDELKLKLETIQESDSGILTGGFTSLTSSFEVSLLGDNSSICSNSSSDCKNSNNTSVCSNSIGNCGGSDNSLCKNILF